MRQHTQRPDGLLALIQQARQHYEEPPPPRNRGRPRAYTGLSFLLLAVTAVTLRTFRGAELHRPLCRDAALRQALGFTRVPHRTTIERRLRSLLPGAEAQVETLGRRLLEEVRPAAAPPQAGAIDGRMYEAAGPKWHKRDRRKGRAPARLRDVDVKSSWFKSGYRGRVQGYRLLPQGLVFPAPVPLWAAWRLNREGEATVMAQALAAGSLPVTPVLLGDETFGGAALAAAYAGYGGWLLRLEL
ncbi:MAG: hypothetical protein M3416_21685 [Acidobacteriota bacterium]|nr:hypothetical protein [Acidobacteriota bacterium]